MNTDDFIDLMKFIGVGVVVTGAIIGVVVLIANLYGQHQCNAYSTVTGKQTRYVQFDECYVKTAQGYQRWDEYKARAVASEGLKKGN